MTTAPAGAFEVIVVNDGTEDGSMEVVRRYADRPDLILIEQENQGLSAARMKGLSKAIGEYVWFVDSDDYLVEDGVGKVLGWLEERPEAEVLMFPLLWMYGDVSKNHLDYQLDGEKVVNGKDVIRFLGLPVWASQRFVFKRKLSDHPRLFFPDALLHEDEYFGPVLLCLASEVHVMTEPVYVYRIHSGSITSTPQVRSSYSMVTIHKMLMQFMEETLSPEDKGWFRSYCCHRLLNSYVKMAHGFGTRSFNRFIRTHGPYVWRQWLEANPDASLKRKCGRLVYFSMPGFYSRCRCR